MKAKKTTSAMFDKNYRDLLAVAKTLKNRKQETLLEVYIKTAVDIGFITENQVKEMMDKQWAGSFYFFERAPYKWTCLRCKSCFLKHTPICRTINDKQSFCLACLTDEEKSNPNAAYTRYMATAKSNVVEPESQDEYENTAKSLLDQLLEEEGLLGSSRK